MKILANNSKYPYRGTIASGVRHSTTFAVESGVDFTLCVIYQTAELRKTESFANVSI